MCSGASGLCQSVLGEKHDLVAYGNGIDEYLPTHTKLRGNPELQKRAMVIRLKNMCRFEGILRGYLTGNGFKAYGETNPHVVCSHALPDGLHDGSEPPEPIFTPSTKADIGHGEHISAQCVREKFGAEPERFCLVLYRIAQAYARERNIIIADTKFELWRGDDGTFGIGDEVLTPDSSHFWLYALWLKAQKRRKARRGWTSNLFESTSNV